MSGDFEDSQPEQAVMKQPIKKEQYDIGPVIG